MDIKHITDIFPNPKNAEHFTNDAISELRVKTTAQLIEILMNDSPELRKSYLAGVKIGQGEACSLGWFLLQNHLRPLLTSGYRQGGDDSAGVGGYHHRLSDELSRKLLADIGPHIDDLLDLMSDMREVEIKLCMDNGNVARALDLMLH